MRGNRQKFVGAVSDRDFLFGVETISDRETIGIADRFGSHNLATLPTTWRAACISIAAPETRPAACIPIVIPKTRRAACIPIVIPETRRVALRYPGPRKEPRCRRRRPDLRRARSSDEAAPEFIVGRRTAADEEATCRGRRPDLRPLRSELRLAARTGER